VNWSTLIPNPIYVRVYKVLNPRYQSEDNIFTNNKASGVLTKDSNLISYASLPEGVKTFGDVSNTSFPIGSAPHIVAHCQPPALSSLSKSTTVDVST